MESKLKALKVVDLKELLSRAQVPIPAKANKPDLIAKIIESRAALSVFEELHGGGSARPSGANTPRPPAVAPVEEKQTPAVELQKESDILAPPEPFDWSAGAEQETEAVTTAKQASAKPPSSKKTSPASTKTAAPSKSSSATQKPSEPPVDEDEELKRRRARAERFGIPFVAKTPQPQIKKTAKPSAATATAPVAAVNGTGTKAKPAKSAVVIEEDPEKLKNRAMRFGISDKPTTVEPSTAAVETVTGQKRSAPAQSLDPEEAERRRKRAERFGLPIKT